MEIEFTKSGIEVDGVRIRIPRGAELDSSAEDHASGTVSYLFRSSYFVLTFRDAPESAHVGTWYVEVDAAHPDVEEFEAVLPMYAREFSEGSGNARLARFLSAVCVSRGGTR